jgi:hypothetical protein
MNKSRIASSDVTYMNNNNIMKMVRTAAPTDGTIVTTIIVRPPAMAPELLPPLPPGMTVLSAGS